MYRRLNSAMLLTTFFCLSAQGQTVEIQAYPAGVIGVVGHTFRHSGHFVSKMHAGINVTDRRDWGEKDDEKGYGFGAGIDINRYTSNESTGLWIGGRIDLWSMLINWRDDTLQIEADSRILVFQPTVRVGYSFDGLGKRMDATLGFGVERNIATHGENVGQGAILLAGLRLKL